MAVALGSFPRNTTAEDLFASLLGGWLTLSENCSSCLCSSCGLVQAELGIGALVWLHRAAQQSGVLVWHYQELPAPLGSAVMGWTLVTNPLLAEKQSPLPGVSYFKLSRHRGSGGTQVLWTRVPLTFHERLLFSPRYLVVLRVPSFNKSTLACLDECDPHPRLSLSVLLFKRVKFF